MRRLDKVRQAISLWRALQTRTWRLEHPDAEGDAPELHYSFRGIEHLRRRLSADDEAWGGYFARCAIEPLELFYETDVKPDPAGAVVAVLTHIGVELPPGWEPAARMVRQSDGLNDAWYSAYHREATVRSGA
jgi:LPS sulfotransferase NodH